MFKIVKNLLTVYRHAAELVIVSLHTNIDHFGRRVGTMAYLSDREESRYCSSISLPR